MADTGYDYEEFRLNMRNLHRNAPEQGVVEDYERRYGDVRPAVRVSDIVDLQRVIRATPILLDWDTLGEGWIVYPYTREYAS